MKNSFFLHFTKLSTLVFFTFSLLYFSFRFSRFPLDFSAPFLRNLTTTSSSVSFLDYLFVSFRFSHFTIWTLLLVATGHDLVMTGFLALVAPCDSGMTGCVTGHGDRSRPGAFTGETRVR